MIYNTLIAPFAEFEFMRRALAGCIALAFGAGVTASAIDAFSKETRDREAVHPRAVDLTGLD